MNEYDLYYEDLIALEAKEEHSKKIAIKLLKSFDFNFISTITELPIEEIKKLKQNI